MGESWNYNKRQITCFQCNKGFEEGAVFFSFLTFREDDVVRGDLCPRCFENRSTEDELIFWRTIHKSEKDAIRFDFDLLLNVLEPLSRDDREGRRDLAFLLSLLLVRHRKLRLTGVKRRKKIEFLELRKVRSSAVFEVEVRELDSERRSKLTSVLADLMDPTQDKESNTWFDVPEEEAI